MSDTPINEPTPEELVASLLELLTLKELGDDRFLGPRKPGGVGRVFGGQVIAQALLAAESTVSEDRPPHSLHVSFLRGGSEDHEVEYRVERLLDGRSFAHRRVTAVQPGGTILTASMSFQRHEDGPHHQAATLPDVPPPDEVESDHDVLTRAIEQLGLQLPPGITTRNAIEMRSVFARTMFDREPRDPVQYVWTKTRAALPNDPRIHRAILAYYSDYRLMGVGTMPHNLAFLRGDMIGASLDHQIWFHDPAPRVDDWLLWDLESPISGNARCLNHGRLFTPEGKLVASAAQEGMFRPIRTKG